MSPLRRRSRTLGSRFPRVSGDEPATATRMSSHKVFSPRERG